MTQSYLGNRYAVALVSLLSEVVSIIGLPRWFSGQGSASPCRRNRFDPWVREIPWRRQWQPTPVFLPGKSHGQRSLEGYSPWGHERVGHDLARSCLQTQSCSEVRRARISTYEFVCVCSVAQLCPTLCDPMSPPGSSVQGIFQARILEWVAVSYSRGSS